MDRELVLTNLTLLDLSGATCYIYMEDEQAEALDKFTAWPKLQVLKATQCNVFHTCTKMHFDTVNEVHLDHCYGMSTLGMVHSPLHLHIEADQFSLQNRVGCKTIVGVKLTAALTKDFKAPNDSEWKLPIDPFLSDLSDLCPLTSLNITYRDCGVSVSPQLLGNKLTQLAELSLSHLQAVAADLDLQLLSCLTRLALVCTDRKRALKAITAPCMLKVLYFTGFSLLLKDFSHNLNTLSSLTEVQVVLPQRYCYIKSDWVPCIPQMPPGLQCFCLIDHSSNSHVDPSHGECDWSGLQSCPDLEWLGLVSRWFSTAHVKRSLKNLQCLHVHDSELFGLENSLYNIYRMTH